VPFRSRFAGSRIPGYVACLAVGAAVGLITASLTASPAAPAAPAGGGHPRSANASSAPSGSAPSGSATPLVRIQAARASWVATWAASPMAASGSAQAEQGFSDQTIRDIVYLSAGGDAVRVHLSNLFGTRPLRIGGASVGIVLDGRELVPASSRRLTFAGRLAVTIPAGSAVTSDPLTGTVAPLAELAISIYLPGATGPATSHQYAGQTTFVAAGDRVADASGASFNRRLPSWYFATEVDVRTATADGTIVAFGDSITDGVGSEAGSDDRWPNFLARRLEAALGDRAPGVVDEGIGGNRVLSGSRCFGQSALARFERDALSEPGVRAVIVLEGINDIGFTRGRATACTTPLNRPMTAARIEAGYLALIAMARARGIKIYLGTLTPAPAREPLRSQVNRWIMTSHAADGVIDFAAATSAPGDPRYFNPAYNSGDSVHPNDLGYAMMANAIPLAWIRLSPGACRWAHIPSPNIVCVRAHIDNGRKGGRHRPPVRPARSRDLRHPRAAGRDAGHRLAGHAPQLRGAGR
jgi:lysophospholipase L1-like esterase